VNQLELPLTYASDVLTELDVDGIIDKRGIRYIGKATRDPKNAKRWTCLADVLGALCLVEVKIDFGENRGPR
jgi:hypothetical protein